VLLSGPHPSIRPPKRTKHADRSPAHASHHRCSACCASFLQVGGLSSRPSALNFALTPAGLGLLGNKREVQFRLTTRFRDGSYYTNFDNTYVRPQGSMPHSLVLGSCLGSERPSGASWYLLFLSK